MVSNWEWTAYKLKYNKHYPPEHDYIHQWRYSAVAEVVRRNHREYAEGRVAYLLNINEFSDTDRKDRKASGNVILEPDEKKMAEVVYNIGPVTVSLDHLYPEFYEYSQGILSIPDCRNGKGFLKHSMLVVGFGTDPVGRDYWLIKNSFGEKWGENGYVRLARNAGNMCGVATFAQYPVF
ncbi:cathepsin L-like [Drosophila serrata]|uniref:cathepsin L-like n=1 Tax=Drosophila serrata TaxID=7274 RepID=UPI000A1CF415|nr:cathepsin L-like [Drosophila serrata]